MKVTTASQRTYIKHNAYIQFESLFKKSCKDESSSEESDDEIAEEDESLFDEAFVDFNMNEY